MRAICVDPAHVEKLWPRVSDLVRKGISYGCEDFEETKENIFSGLSLLWLAYDGVVIRGIAVTGLFGDACEIIAAAGQNFRSWGHLIGDLEAYGRDEKSSRMRLIGRRGWRRILKNYQHVGNVGELVILERPL